MSEPTESPEAVVNAYTEGTRTRNTALLRQLFDDKALMTGWLGPDFLNGGPGPFFDALDANEVGSDYASETTALVVTDKIASATVEEKNLLGMNFTNHFHLAQIADGTWRITSKLFRHH